MTIRALISVSDKTGLVDFARRLHAIGIEIISTGGTMKTLMSAGIPVTYVGDVTGFPEIMDGRVKTLNPLIHGGILAVRDNAEHRAAMQQHGICAIDLVVVNLYPFRETVANPAATLTEAVENIDIGGPAMIRAAAKNFRYVTVVVNPQRYEQVWQNLEQTGTVDPELRMALAREAYAHTSEYDACIARYLSEIMGEGPFPDKLHLVYDKWMDLRYGENPHQQAAFYRTAGTGTGIAQARQLHGKELSYNNIVDLEAAWTLVQEFTEPAAVIIKHTNPCGTGIGTTIGEAYQSAYEADPVSAFGGIVALNRTADATVAEKISTLFAEAVVAPAFSEESLMILTGKKNIRLLEMSGSGVEDMVVSKHVSGGLLVQQVDRTADDDPNRWQMVTKRQPTPEEKQQLAFAWKVAKHVKSNAIVVAKGSQTVGVGAGQMNRVGAAEIALRQAGSKAQGAVLASDAFFPFADTVEAAAQAGITAIIQPGGSMRDAESVAAADKHGIAMIFTGIRHFKH